MFTWLASKQDSKDLVPCRNPLVSLAYEKGWRQSFGWAGFPGPHWPRPSRLVTACITNQALSNAIDLHSC